MKKINPTWIKEAGYQYDSSLNPTWIPGKYNNFSMPRMPYQEGGITEVPVSVSANLRIPLFWLSFKNFPYTSYKKIAIQTLRKDGYLSLYFHPWEFIDLSNYNVPYIIRRKSGAVMLEKIKILLADLKNEGDFITMISFLNNRGS